MEFSHVYSYSQCIDFAPMVEGFGISSIPGRTSPAVQLMWSNPFDAILPIMFNLSYNATKLSGDEIQISDSFSLTLDDLGNETDYVYELTDLLFYTKYEFEIAAVYNVTGTSVESEPVNMSHITEEGGIVASYNILQDSPTALN